MIWCDNNLDNHTAYEKPKECAGIIYCAVTFEFAAVCSHWGGSSSDDCPSLLLSDGNAFSLTGGKWSKQGATV